MQFLTFVYIDKISLEKYKPYPWWTKPRMKKGWLKRHFSFIYNSLFK
jgi:hypothetical protein